MMLTRGRRQLGHAVIDDPTVRGGKIEEDSITCMHCSQVYWIKPFERPPECTCCDKYICIACIGKGCVTIERRLGLIEKAPERSAFILSPNFKAEWA